MEEWFRSRVSSPSILAWPPLAIAIQNGSRVTALNNRAVATMRGAQVVGPDLRGPLHLLARRRFHRRGGRLVRSRRIKHHRLIKEGVAEAEAFKRQPPWPRFAVVATESRLGVLRSRLNETSCTP